jgi:hypothetical protein
VLYDQQAFQSPTIGGPRAPDSRSRIWRNRQGGHFVDNVSTECPRCFPCQRSASLLLPILTGVVATLLASAPASGEGSRSSGPSKSLQAKAADPTEPLIQFTLDNDVAVSNHSGSGAAYQLLVQPVIPLPPLRWLPVGQIICPSIPVIVSPGPDRVTGLGDITVFDIFLPRRFSWGLLEPDRS